MPGSNAEPFGSGNAGLGGRTFRTILPFGDRRKSMKIEFVKEHGLGEKPTVVPIETGQTTMIALEQLITSQVLPSSESPNLCRLFDTIKQQRLWIMADDRLLTPVNVAQRYHLREFARTRRSGAKSDAKPFDPNAPLGLHSAFPQLVEVPNKGDYARQHSDREEDAPLRHEGLAGPFLHAIDRSGLLRLAPRDDENWLRKRLLNELGRYALWPGMEATKELIACWSGPASLKELGANIRKCAPRWAKGGRPYGLLVAEASELDERSALVRCRSTHHRLKFDGRNAVFCKEITTGPWLGLISVAQTREDEYRPCLAYWHPILRRDCWLTVDSNPERELASMLEFVASRGALHGAVVARTQLEDRKIPGVFPDFCATYHGRYVPMELLGRVNDPEYCRVKERQRQICMDAGMSRLDFVVGETFSERRERMKKLVRMLFPDRFA